jgi:peptide/nickel transport system substrate-binding protein
VSARNGLSAVSRRRFLQGAGSLAALSAVPALGSGTARAARQEQTPVSGGDLLFVHQQIPASMDANVWTGTNVARIMRQIYDPLVWQPEGGVFVPGLAESWEVSDDGLSYTFNLRQDVVFHDGTPFNAEAVKATYDRMVDPESKSLQVSRLGPYDKTEVLDEYTVRVVLTEPFVVFLSNVSEVALAPASPTAIAAMGDEYIMRPVATGPFRVRDWPDETTLVLERNPDYAWAPDFIQNRGPAYLDTITYRFVEEPATRLIALETGEAAIIDAPPPEDIQTLLDSDDFQVDAFVVPGMPEHCPINTTSGPTQELAVRQAMLHGVDREALALLLFNGGFPAANGPLTSGSWAYWDGVADMYPYDLERAAQLLDEAGWTLNADGIREKNGETLTVRAVTTAGGDPQKVAEFVQGSLAELGFDYVVEAMEYEATARRYADNDFEVARLFYALIDPHDAFFLAFDSSQIEGGGQFNRSRIASDEIDGLIQQGVTESDTAKRMEIYQQLQQMVMEQALILPAYETRLVHALQPNVQGFSADLLGRPYMIDVWLQG